VRVQPSPHRLSTRYPREYRDLHLPGAISIPLKELTEQSTSRLQKDRPVIVYCSDYAPDEADWSKQGGYAGVAHA
jgi:rhodanese-related sulfurtransferase